MEKTVCSECGTTYSDEGDIELVKKWLNTEDGYAPCPNFSCAGQMEIKET